MERKEFKIGDVFQFGHIELECVKTLGCEGCLFKRSNCNNIRQAIGPCCPQTRTDKESVGFIVHETQEYKEKEVCSSTSGN